MARVSHLSYKTRPNLNQKLFRVMADPHHSTNKASFVKLFRGDDVQRERIVQYVEKCHWLVYHATHVLKLHMLSDPDLTRGLRTDLIEHTLYLLNGPYNTKSVTKRASLDEIRPTVKLYEKHVTGYTPIALDSAQQTIHYLTAMLNANITVNIQSHFCRKILGFINRRLDVKGAKKSLKLLPDSNAPLRDYNSRLRHVKAFILLDSDLPGDMTLSDDEEILRAEISSILPYDTRQDNSLAYNVAADAKMFFASYCRLSNFYEAYRYPQFSAIPCKALNHAPIDTKILCKLIYKDHLLVKDMVAQKSLLWYELFDVDNKAFRPRGNLTFNGRTARR